MHDQWQQIAVREIEQLKMDFAGVVGTTKLLASSVTQRERKITQLEEKIK